MQKELSKTFLTIKSYNTLKNPQFLEFLTFKLLYLLRIRFSAANFFISKAKSGMLYQNITDFLKNSRLSSDVFLVRRHSSRITSNRYYNRDFLC